MTTPATSPAPTSPAAAPAQAAPPASSPAQTATGPAGAAGAPGAPAPSPAPAAPGEASRPKASDALERALAADRKAREERDQLKRDREAWAKERETHEKELADARRLRQLIKDDPREFLRETGVSYEQLTKAIASGARVPPELRELQKEIEALKGERQTEKQQAEERAKVERERADAAVFTEFTSAVKAEAATYGAAAWLVESDAANARALVEDVARQIHEETGRVPTYQDAAKRLDETLRTDFERMLSVPVFRELAAKAFAAEADKAKADPTKRDPQQLAQHASTGTSSTDGPSTITNDHGTAVGARGERKLSDAEAFDALVDRVEKAKRKS